MDHRVTDYIANANTDLQPILDYIRQTIHEAYPKIEENMEIDFGLYANMVVFGDKAKMKGWKHLKNIESLPEKDILIRLV